MLLLYNCVNKAIDTEKEVYEFIFSKLSSGEKMLNDRKSLAKFFQNQQSLPDAYLPEGCKILGFPKNTSIEIRYGLKPGSVSRFLKTIEFYNQAYTKVPFSFYRIYKETATVDPTQLNTMGISCIPVEEFCEWPIKALNEQL